MQLPALYKTSNTALFFELLPPHVVSIGITGTKGKSTTSSLLAHVLKTAGLPTILGGNMGVPPLDLLASIAQLPTTAPVYAVLELSSHQLSLLSSSPHIAIVQEIVPEHLDYYASFADYVAAKSHIVQHQSAQDVVVYSTDFATTTTLAAQSKGMQLVYSLRSNDSPVSVTNTHLFYNSEPVLAKADLPLLGNHNLYNIAPVVLVAKHLQIESRHIAAGLKSFIPLPHRLQPVKTTDEVLYVNDSLATTPQAACAALSAFEGRSIIYIGGGHDRHLDYHPLATELLKHAIKALILFPPTGEILLRQLQQLDPTNPLLQTACYKVTTMSEAVRIATNMAKPHDVVLLSPGAASFGLFVDYEDRGNQFMSLVEELRG